MHLLENGLLHVGRDLTAASMIISVGQKVKPPLPGQHFLLQSCKNLAWFSGKIQIECILGHKWPRTSLLPPCQLLSSIFMKIQLPATCTSTVQRCTMLPVEKKNGYK